MKTQLGIFGGAPLPIEHLIALTEHPAVKTIPRNHSIFLACSSKMVSEPFKNKRTTDSNLKTIFGVHSIFFCLFQKK
jgi:hypothetical protein